MKDVDKTKEQLIDELVKLCHRNAGLEKLDLENKGAEEASQKAREVLEQKAEEHNSELVKANARLKREIKERRQAEESLKESEECYRDLVEKAGIGILIDDKEGNFKYVNEKCAEIFGYSNKAMKKQSIQSIVHPDDVTRVMIFHKQRLQGKDVPSRYEFRGVRKDGSIVYLEVDAVELKKGESIIGTLSYLRDIIERKREEKILEHDRGNLVRILDMMGEGIYIINKQYDIEYLNPALKKEYGPVRGKKCYEYFLDRKEVCPSCKSQDVFAGKTFCYEWYSFKNQKTYELISTPLKNPDGSVSKLEMLRDITERKQSEEALRKSELKLQEQKLALEQKNIALREIISQVEIEKRRIEDDIQTNVSIVLSPILEMLKRDNATQRYANLIQHHLEELISSYGSKIKEESFKLTPREIEVCNLIKGALSNKDISHTLNISYQTVEGHRKKIRQKLGISNKHINLTSFLREF